MRRKNLWLRLSSCTMAALIATTSVVPAAAAEVDFQDEAFVDGEETDQAEVPEETAEVTGEGETVIDEAAPEEAETATSEEVDLATEENAAPAEEVTENQTEEAGEAEFAVEDVFSGNEEETSQKTDATEPANEAETTGNAFGTTNKELKAGTYEVIVALKKTDKTSASMASACINGKATLTVKEDGTATLTVPLTSITMGSVTAWAKNWKVYPGELTDGNAAAATEEKNADGNVSSITFAIVNKAADGVFVNMQSGGPNANDAYLSIDYANAAAKETVKADTTALEATIAKADALNEMAYTKASWDGNKDAIEAAKTAAKAALEAKESQEAVDAANAALTDAMNKLVVTGDLAALKEVLEKAKTLNETDYTAKTWKYVQDAIDKAETVIANRDTKRKVTSAKSSLNIWMGKLVRKYDTTTLEKKIAEAEALKKDDYTAESWKEAAITNVINAAKETVTNRGNKDDVHSAIDNLETAMEKLVPVSKEITVGRGNYEKKLAPGTYSLPIQLLNGGKSDDTNQYTTANYMNQLSMAAGCFTGNATLVIHEDGTATLTTGVQAITAMGMTGAASDWTIYENTQDYLDGKANATTGARFKAHVDASKVQAGKKKPSQISFTIPDLKQNVVATRMYIEVMSVNQDACIGLDWSSVEKVSNDTSATSTVEKEYVVKADTLTQLKNMKAGNTVQLEEDVTLAEDLTIKGGVLDLNGHVLNQKDNLIMIKGDVTVIDSSAGKTGKITREKYFENSQTTTSISVQKGSFTAEGITIDGQIGNKIHTGDQVCLKNNPRVTVKLTNCTLINTVKTDTLIGGGMNIAFAYLANGIDVTIDSCTADKGVYISDGSGEKTVINKSSLGELTLGGTAATVTETTTTGKAHLGADEITIKDDSFVGLKIDGSGDTILENINSKGTSLNCALEIGGSGQITVKSGVYTNDNGSAIRSSGFPVVLEGGYFKGTKSVDGAYTTPAGKILGDVTEGEYAGYQTVVDGTDPEVTDPVATVYNADGTVAKKISAENAALTLSYATEGQTVKLNKDLETDSVSFYKNCTFDLNGHVLNLGEGSITGQVGTCRVIDSSTEKTGKITGTAGIFGGNKNAVLVLDGITSEALYMQGVSAGNIYVTGGSSVKGVFMLNAVMGGGKTHIQDSSWIVAQADYQGNPVDGNALLTNCTRTSQYTITETGDHTYTVTINDLGKAMRAFEALDASAYTKTSYAAAKAVYDEIDGTADEDIQGDVVAQKAKELNDAIANLQAPATEASVNTLKSAITAAKKLKSTDYTAASFKIYTAAITAAEKVLEGEELSETEVTEATKALDTAKAKLVKMQAQTITISANNSNGVISKKYGDKAFSLGAKAKTGLTYKSSNTKVVTVDSKGNVTIKAAGTATITITAKATQDYKAATRTVTVKVAKVQKAQSITVSVKNSNGVISRKYGDKAFSLGAKAKTGLTYKSSNTKIAIVDGKGNVTIKAPGTVKITITAKASSDYKTAAKILTVKIAKKNATIKTKTSAKTIKYATLKKNAQVFTLGASVDSKGTLTYKKLSGSSAITVSSKTGKFTVKKGLKKGTYKVKVQIKSAAKGNYNAGSRTVTVTVTVK